MTKQSLHNMFCNYTLQIAVLPARYRESGKLDERTTDRHWQIMLNFALLCYASINAGNTLLLCCLTMWCVYMHVQFTNSAMAKAADIADPIEGIAAEVFFVSNLCFVVLVASCKHCEEIREIKYLLRSKFYYANLYVYARRHLP